MQTVRLIALCLAQIVATAVFAERGVVKGNNGLTYEGDIEETPTQVIIRRNKIEQRLERQEIVSIHYLSTDAEEIKQQWSGLKNDDAPGRVTLARQAFERGQYDLARSIVTEAMKIDPNNRDAVDLQEIVRRQIVMEARAARDRQLVDKEKHSPYALPETYLDEHDINSLRQSELQTRDDGKVRVRFDNDVRRRFVQQHQYNPATFAKLSAFQQAMTMIREGNAAIRRDVIILDDPAAIREYRAIQRNILTSCASQVCHGSLLAGNFILFPVTENDAATYTNLYFLTRYTWKSPDQNTQDIFTRDARQRRMIDRERPIQSLLLQYALPPATVEFAHPHVPNMHPAFTNTNDPIYGKIYAWIYKGLRRVEVQPEMTYVSPLEQMLRPSTQPSAAPATGQAARAMPATQPAPATAAPALPDQAAR